MEGDRAVWIVPVGRWLSCLKAKGYPRIGGAHQKGGVCTAVVRLTSKMQRHCLLAACHGLNGAHQNATLKFLPLVPEKTTGFGSEATPRS